MRKFTKHPKASIKAAKADKWYTCPECHNKAVVPVYPDNTPLVDEGDVFICNECGAEFEAHPLYNGEVKFTLPFNEYVQRHGPGGPDDLTDDDYDYWYSRWEAYVDSIKRRVNSAKEVKASSKKASMTFDEYCQSTWGIPSSKLTADDKKRAEEEYHNVTKQPVQTAADATYKTDRRLSPTSVRYRGYLIVLDRGGDGYNIYDKHRELEDAGYSSLESAKKCVDDIIREENGGIKAAEETDTYWMAMRKFTKHPSQHKQVNSSTDTTRIPVPYNKYFEIDPPTRDADLLPGDRIEDYDCTFLAYLAPKPEYEDTLDMWPVLTDLTDYPVCDLVAGRLYPITPEDIHRHLGDTEYLVESSTSYNGSIKFTESIESATSVDDKKIDRRLSSTSKRYKGYRISLDTRHECYNIYDAHGELEDHGFKSVDDAMAHIDELVSIESATDPADYEDDIQEISQEFTSENTSINSGKLPAIFKLIHLAPGTINIDYGGGKFDNVAEYLAPMDVINLVYDPYNRTPEHNREVIRTVKKAGGADSATCSNVLNVIKEPEVRRNVLENIRRVVKPEGVVYITVYEGSGRGNEGPTKSGYQLNRKTADYLDEIKEVFPDAIRKGKLIIAHPSGSVASSVECAADVSKKDLLFLAKKAAEVTTAEDLEEIISSLLSVDKKLYTKYSEEVRSDKSPAAIGKDISDELYWMTQDDEVTAANYGGDTIMSASSISMKAIHDKLLNAASKRMQKSDMGFPLSEIADYLVVEEEETEDGALKIEVRCELDYEGMEKLAEVLDPIVARYDNDAYFDMVAPGIMEAFIFNKNVTADSMTPVKSSRFNFPELPLEPPDYDEPEEHSSIEYIIVDLDDDILVGVDTLDFQSIPKFEGEEVDWVLNEYPNIQIDYSENVMDHVLEVLEPQIPAEPGLYRVRGRVKLAYDVVVYTYYESEGPDDGEYVADEDLTSIDFNYKKSSIENLEVGKD